MLDDPFAALGLKPISFADKPVFDACFASLRQPLSDYTFAQLFSWSNSLRIFWREIRGNLCVFANGTGDLTLLMPPIGEGGADAALRQAFEIMDTYNRRNASVQRSRVEYASAELMQRLDWGGLCLTPMGGDYVYETGRMIDLAGSALASKRQLKNRFQRLYEAQVECYEPERHLSACLGLLDLWESHQGSEGDATDTTAALKRRKEVIACRTSLRHAAELGLCGRVIHTRSRPSEGQPGTGEFVLSAFTFGEALGADQASILIEKTDLSVRGLAQFIFSEFCRMDWSHVPLINAGDDWGLESLGFTKRSYRPVKMLEKFAFTMERPVAVSVPEPVETAPVSRAELAQAEYRNECWALPLRDVAPPAEVESAAPVIRMANRNDLDAAVGLEHACFSAHQLTKRQLRYLQARPSAVFLVAESQGQVIGSGIALLRRHGKRSSGRIYSLAVAREHRRKKIGRRLMEQMIQSLRDAGAQRVYLEVDATNAGAIALYERMGFENFETLNDYYAPGQHAVHMRMKLTRAQRV